MPASGAARAGAGGGKGGQSRTIRIIRSDEIIAGLTHPLSADEMDGLTNLIVDEGAQLDVSERTEAAEDIRVAEEHAKAKRSQLEGVRRRAGEVRSDLDAAEPGTLFRGLTYLICALACIFSEFALTYYTLPFILDVPEGWLRVAIAAAPTSALIILELAFQRMLEDPWRNLRRRAESGRGKRLALGVAMFVFLLSVGAGNILTVWYLAEIREQATMMKTDSLAADTLDTSEPALAGAPTGVEERKLDPAQVRKTVVAVSLLVAVDGALLLLVGICEMQAHRRRRQLEREAALLEKQTRARESDLEAATNGVAILEARAATTEERCRTAAACYVRMREVELQAAQSRLLREAGLESLVNDRLTGRFGPRGLAVVK
jgi:hypothetical protein